MQRIMLKSKIHRATVTGLELDYEGSIAIDPILLAAADILPGEQVQVLNLQNGERLITYAILGKRGSGQMMLNGPAARLAITFSSQRTSGLEMPRCISSFDVTRVSSQQMASAAANASPTRGDRSPRLPMGVPTT